MSEVILVTGFGPFGIHNVNASWEAVKLLPDNFENYNILKYEIPVSYTDVEEKIPKLWISHKPKLVIHVGVSKDARKITVEKMANRTGYEKLDCYGKKHPTGNVCNVGDDCIPTSINVTDICKLLNAENEVVQYTTSENAGRFLCEYIYYTSLNQDRNRSLFIHVPPLETPYTAQQLSEAILRIIACSLKENCIDC